jgi:hypothetical protein
MRRGSDWAGRGDVHVSAGGVSTATLQVLARSSSVAVRNNDSSRATLGCLVEGGRGHGARLMMA